MLWLFKHYGKGNRASLLNFTYRYIDDILTINNPGFENNLGQMYPVEREIKYTTEKTTLLLTWICYCRFIEMVGFGLPTTTNEMVSISTSQTFRSWVVVFRLRWPMVFLSLDFCDTPGLAPRLNVLFWGPGDFTVSYAWNRTCNSGHSMVDTGILFSNMEYPIHKS